MQSKEIIKKTYSAEETLILGQELSKSFQKKDIILLEGNLGGGKTTFVRGVLTGLGFSGRVLSPSFTIVRHYPTKSYTVHHIDLYRLEAKDDILDLGLEEYFYDPNGVTFIEWGEKIEYFFSKYIKIIFSYLGQESRNIKILSISD